MNAAEHLERNLGPMEVGWSSDSLGGVQVCLFRNQPVHGALTLATLGLSDTVLAMADGRGVRQELLLAIHDDRAPEEFVKLVLHIAERQQRNGQALLRGDVISLGEQLAADSAAESLYASMPVVFPEGIETLSDSSPPTVFVWLVPILPREASFIASSGWSGFEDRVESADPDLFDVCRVSVI
jgi:hypothetical protein